MYALVSTTRFLLLVDVARRTVTPLEGSRPEYYGISWFPGGQDLVLTHSGLDNGDLVDLASYAQSELGWVSHGALASTPFLSQPHQALCASDGRVICTNTGRNAITIVDLKRPGHFQEARISGARWDRLALDGETADHLNSVFERDGRLYAVAHGHARGSKIVEFAYPEMRLLSITPVEKKTGLHNLWATGEGELVCCHSEAGALIDVAADRVLWEAGSPIYTRGLAASDELVLVGESQKIGRELRRSSMSGLWILDRKSWKTLDYLGLGPYGAVNEVRWLDVPDHAHHGQPFAGLDPLLARDMRADVTRERLAAAASASTMREHWGHLELIFGAPTSAADGMRSAPSDQLCLAVAKSPALSRLAFDYRLEGSSGKGHVSAVADYAGAWSDRQMFAFLLHPAGDSAALGIWQHDGQAWQRLPGFDVRGLPTAARMEIARGDRELVVSIDREAVLRLERTTLPIGDGPLGIRWLGASVLPAI